MQVLRNVFTRLGSYLFGHCSLRSLSLPYICLQVHRHRGEATLSELVIQFCNKFGPGEARPHAEKWMAVTEHGSKFSSNSGWLPFSLVQTLATVFVSADENATDKTPTLTLSIFSGWTYEVLKLVRGVLGMDVRLSCF